jgi:hypothetical protein
MNYKDNLKTKKNFSFWFLLIVLTMIVSFIMYYRIKIQMDIGPVSDTCDFFSNAFLFAGQGIGYSDLTRPPLFSFLISLMVRLGYTSMTTIYVADCAFLVFGVIGLYILLRLRFTDLESFLGSLLFATLPVILSVVGFGFSDISSVAFTIWTFYFLILAVKKDSKFFYLTFPFAMFAFLARYNSALIIFPMFLYILINKMESRDLKSMMGGIFLSLLALIPVFIFFYQFSGNPLYSFMSSFGTSSGVSSAENISYDSNIFYFIEMLPRLVGVSGILIILITAFGGFIYELFKLRKGEGFKKFDLSFDKTKIKLLVLAILVGIFVGTFGNVTYMLSEVTFFVTSYLFYDLLRELNVRDMDLHLLIFAWFMAFFIFQSVCVIKVARYFILMAPAIVYFLILGLTEISKRLICNFKGKNITFFVLSITLICIMLLSTASYLPSLPEANHKTTITDEEISSASVWLVNYDPSYKNKVIYSELWPYFGWYLRTDVKPLPLFKDNQTFYASVKNPNFTEEDNAAFNNELKSINADYYLCSWQEVNLTSYTLIKRVGTISIYEKTDEITQ